MKHSSGMILALAFAAVAQVALATAQAAIVPTVVSGYAGDTNSDGLGDTSGALPWVERTTVTSAARIVEFDISAYSGATLASATLGGWITAGNSGFTATPQIEVFAYTGDGALSASDYQAPGTSLFTFSYQQPNMYFFNQDLTSALQVFATAGASFVGLRFVPLNLQPVSIASPVLDIVVAPVPIPAAVWLLFSGLAGLGIVARRRSAARY